MSDENDPRLAVDIDASLSVNFHVQGSTIEVDLPSLIDIGIISLSLAPAVLQVYIDPAESVQALVLAI